ncbi:TPA: conjugative relaxase [Pasteurella multocida]|nr:conjugative relaxase [Pasteurella multocida]
MLSVAKVSNSQGAASYYEQKDNYYFQGSESMSWFGKAAEKLGLFGKDVDIDIFKNVLDGKLTDGTDLSYIKDGINRHRAGYDFTFSAPKSVSILALVEEDKDVLEAHKTAVNKTLSEIEQLASTRSMKDGIPIITNTNNILATLFLHDTSRNLDPHLHTHAVISNITFDDTTQRWKTLSTDKVDSQAFVETIWKNQVAFGSIYRQFLKEELANQGYEFINTGKNGLWEIKGVPTEVFSTRRKEIVESVGIDASAKSLSIATKDTRKAKDFSNIDAIRQDWKEKLREAGFNKNQIQHNNLKATISYESVFDAVENAITLLERSNIKISYEQLFANIVNSIEIKEGVFAAVKQEIFNAVNRNRLVIINKDGNLFTTDHHLKNEQAVSNMLLKLDSKKSNLINKPDGDSVLLRNLINRNSAINIFSIRGSVAFEISQIESINKLAKENNRDHVVIVNDKKDMSLFEKLEIKAMTFDEFLRHDNEKKQIVTIYRAEKFNLDKVQKILSTSYLNDDTVIMLDAGTKRKTGLAFDIAESVLDKEISKLIESDSNKKFVVIDNIDKSHKKETIANLYTKFYAANQSAIIKSSSNEINPLTSSIRENLLEYGLLSTKSTTVKAHIEQYLDVSNRNNRKTYKIGYLLEDADKNSYKIVSINEQTNKLLLVDKNGSHLALSVNKIDASYKLYKEIDLELREGDKLKSTGSFSQVKAGEELTVRRIKSENIFFKEMVFLEDKKGNVHRIYTDKVTKLSYDYVTSIHDDRNKVNTIAVVSDKQVDSATITQLKRNTTNLVLVTNISKDIVNDRINKESITQIINDIDITDYKIKDVNRLDKLVSIAIDKATLMTRDKVFFNRNVLLSVMSDISDTKISSVIEHLSSLEKKGEIIQLSNGNYITKDSLNNEINILKRVTAAKNQYEQLVNNIDKSILSGLTKGQAQAAEMILSSRDGVMLIQGYAGVGKTTQFKFVKKILEQQKSDTQLIGLSTTHKAVSELNKAGIRSQTIASFLLESDTINKNQFENKLFIIDESSMIGNKTLSVLLDVILNHGGRAVLVGDKMQLKSLDGGTPFALVNERSAIDKSIMQEIVRQKPSLKPAVEMLIKQDIHKSLDYIKSNTTEILRKHDFKDISNIYDLKNVDDKSNHYLQIAKDYASRADDYRDNTLIITAMNKDRAEINRYVHEEMKNNHDLSRNSIVVPVLTRIYNQESDLRSSIYWIEHKNDVVKIGNEYFKINEIYTDTNTVKLTSNSNDVQYLSIDDVSTYKVAFYAQSEIEINQNEKIRATSTDRERIILSQDIGTVQSINSNNGDITIKFGNKEVIYNPLKNIEDQHLDYGYAVTSYASQGASYEYTIIYDGVLDGKSKLSALDNTYVEVSRAKQHIQLYVDDLEKWQEHIKVNTGSRLTIHDLIDKHDINTTEHILSYAKDIPDSIAEKLPDYIVQAAKMVSSTELVIPVINDTGVRKGLYHIPYKQYTGDIDFEKAYYAGDKDGQYIVFKGSNDNEVVQINIDDVDIEALLKLSEDEKTIVLSLNNNEDERSDLIIETIEEERTNLLSDSVDDNLENAIYEHEIDAEISSQLRDNENTILVDRTEERFIREQDLSKQKEIDL